MLGELEILGKKQIFVLSDGIGLTADTAIHSALAQFQNIEVEVNRVTMVRDKTRLVEVIRTAQKTDGIIVYTLVSKELRQFFFFRNSKAESSNRRFDRSIIGNVERFFRGFSPRKAGGPTRVK